MDIKFIDYETLKQVVDRIKVLLNKKADIEHKHLPTEITTDSNNQFMNAEEKLKVSKIQVDGLGNKALLDNGSYKQLVDDSSTSNETTFSSNKIIEELKGKSDVTHTHLELHEHTNKTVLDTITEENLADWNAKATTEYVDKQVSGMTGLNPEFVDTITKEIENKVDKVEGKSLSANDYTDDDKNKLSGIEENANNYIHPVTHNADIILETETKRFVSDIEKDLWNNKIDKVVGMGLSSNDYTDADKAKLFGLSNYSHPNSGVTASTYTKVTVNAQGHVTSGSNPTTLAEFGITDGASKIHTHASDDITSLDASKLTGTIDIERLPAGALERLVIVADDTARFALTTSNIQNGDTVKVTATGFMYFVVDDTKLSTESGYEPYTAGTATSVAWSGITGKPDTFTPSSHAHTKSEIADFPTSLKNPTALTISVNGINTVYDGATEKTITINENTLGITSITTSEIDTILATKRRSNN